FVYQSDEKNPWRYVWVHFQGAECEDICRAMGFSREHPVATFGNLEKLYHLHQKTEQVPFDDFAWQLEHKIRLYAFFKGMMEHRVSAVTQQTEVSKRRAYFNKAVDYIMNHLEDDTLSAERVAAQIPVCRKYLLTLFRAFCQTTTKDFIMSKRVEQAKRLLQYTGLTVGEVATACGYKDMLTFSRVFKKRVGMSPRTYRQQKTSG
ncbi:MAG: helix-turn-helix domain-containing protein, partial [Clostridia bacterium]|nr:helix-turn-helix domain-containing protein [Clostridia bacterium]